MIKLPKMYTLTNSTVLDCVGYDKDEQKMFVKYKDGNIYQYNDVLYKHFSGIIKAPSPMSALNRLKKVFLTDYTVVEESLADLFAEIERRGYTSYSVMPFSDLSTNPAYRKLKERVLRSA